MKHTILFDVAYSLCVLTLKTFQTECNLSTTIDSNFSQFVSNLNPTLFRPQTELENYGKSDGTLTVVSHQRVQRPRHVQFVAFCQRIRVFQTNSAAGSEFFITICVLSLVESSELLQRRHVGDSVSLRCPLVNDGVLA